MSHDERHRQMGDRETGVLRQRDQRLDGIEAARVGELLREVLRAVNPASAGLSGICP
ncbi:MAG: hypothetical protein ABW026_17450 [Microvirga sp.]